MWYKEVVVFFVLFCLTIKRLNACGRPSILPNTDTHFKISGGTEAIPYSWPWQAYIFFTFTDTVGRCAGTLINNNWILTVAHCFLFSEVVKIKVKLGIFDKTKCPSESLHYHYDKEQINSTVFLHPNFHDTNNDIALIQLPEDVEYTDHISPVCLPRHDSTVNVVGNQLTITGWGKTNATYRPNKLRQAVVVIQPAHRPNVFSCRYIPWFDKKSEICAGLRASGAQGRKGPCVGDSGGPLVWKNRTSNKWFQYGIISGGGADPCGKDNKNAGPFGVLLSVATLEGRSYVFDVRKCGLTPALRWYLSSPNMVKIVWDVNCEKKVLANTFGITQATAAQGYYDAQHWARDARVQNGLKTRLSDFVALFRGIDISPQKEQFHAFNWNTPHWQFDDTKKAIYYSACDSLYNLQVAVGLATCLTHIPVQYKTIAHRLRRHGMKL